MKFTEFLSLPKTLNLVALGNWKKSVKPISLLMKKIEKFKADRKQKEKEIAELKEI